MSFWETSCPGNVCKACYIPLQTDQQLYSLRCACIVMYKFYTNQMKSIEGAFQKSCYKLAQHSTRVLLESSAATCALILFKISTLYK